MLIMDRVNHSLLNTLQLPIKALYTGRLGTNSAELEADLLSNCALNRAFYNGMIFQDERWRKLEKTEKVEK